MSGNNPYRAQYVGFTMSDSEVAALEKRNGRQDYPTTYIRVVNVNPFADLVSDLRDRIAAPPPFTNPEMQQGYNFGLRAALEMALEWAAKNR